MKNLFSLSFLGLLALILFGCPSPVSTVPTPSSTPKGILTLVPLNSGGTVSRSLAGSASVLSLADSQVVTALASSGLVNYTNSLTAPVDSSARATVVTNAGNALGSITVGASGYTLFILQNTGTAPLYDVQFSVSDGLSAADFTIVPGTLTLLNTSGTSTFMPLVTLNIHHGNVIANGQPVAGQYNYLPFTVPASANVTATVRIYAWNTSDTSYVNGVPQNHTLASAQAGGADTELDATLLVTVQRAEWVVLTGAAGTVIPLTAGGVYGTSGDLTPYLKNTGNVPLTVSNITAPSGTASVAVGAVSPLSYDTPSAWALFKVDTGGAVYHWNITTPGTLSTAVWWSPGTSQTTQFVVR